MKALQDFILSKLMMFSSGEYEGMTNITLSELYQLKGIVEATISNVEQSDLEHSRRISR
jgi:hypothetical protein